MQALTVISRIHGSYVVGLWLSDILDQHVISVVSHQKREKPGKVTKGLGIAENRAKG